MSKRFTCSAGSFSIEQAINGQTPLGYYDALAQIATNPSLREDIVLCYKDSGIEGIFSQLQSVVNSDKRWVTTNPFYWTEKCQPDVIFTTIKKASAPSTPGGTVTVTVDKSSHSRGGQFSKPMNGHRAYIKELNGQGADIIAKSTTTPGQHTITLEALNGEVLDLTRHSNYTLLVDPLRMYKKGDSECIKTRGVTHDQPILRRGYIQKYEEGYEIHDDEITGYAYDVEFKLAKGVDPITGKLIEYYNIPALTNEALKDYMDSKNINVLHGIRNDVKQEGVEGLFTSARSQGMFSRYYDPNDGVSLKINLFNMMKSLRRVSGPKEWMFVYDWGFNQDWSESIAALVKATVSTQSYKLFGDGGEGVRNFKWYEFKDFEAYGYSFRGYMVDAFDTQRYGNFNENFAYLMPLTKYKDTGGKDVAPVTFVNMGAAEDGPEKHIWVDDTRKRGCRYLDVYVQDQYGMENHCVSKTGVWQRQRC